MNASLGRLGLIGFTLSALSPAASVFISGSGLLKLAGTGTAPVLIVGAVIATLAAMLFAEVAAAVPHAGGIYAGLERLLGRWARDIAIVLATFTAPAYLAFSAKGLATYLGVFAGVSAPVTFAVSALALAACAATWTLRSGIVIASVLLVIEILAVGALAVIAGTEQVRPIVDVLTVPVAAEGAELHPVGPIKLAFASIAATFACSGAVWGSYLGEDTRPGQRRFGGTLALTGLLGALLVAVPLILVTLAIPDLPMVLGSAAPLATFVESRTGAGGARLLSLLVAAAIFANLLTMTIALSRFVFATGRDGIWPRAVSNRLGRLDRNGMPIVATAVLVAAALPFLLLSEHALLIMLSAELISPLLVAVAVLVGGRRAGEQPYRAPAYPVLPIVGIVLASLFMLLEWNEPSTGRKGIIALIALVLVTVVARRLRRR